MEELQTFIIANPGTVAAAAGALLALGGAIVKATPTKTDDAWWRAFRGLIGKGEKK